MKKTYFITLFLALMFIQTGSISADQKSPANDTPSMPANSYQQGWLGVFLTPVSPSLTAQLASILPAGQGVLVASVEPDSPAHQAGIKKHDILLHFNDQKLFSAAQLSALVASASTDKPVSLQLIRAAKLLNVDVQVSKRTQPANRYSRPGPNFRNAPLYRGWRPPINQFRKTPDIPLAWDSFESVIVKTIGEGRYHAEVSFRDHSNETRNFTFEGYKQDIIRQIREQKDLPADKKKALLEALDMRTGRFNSPFNNDFFRNGFFNNAFTHDPFFNDYNSRRRSPFDRSFPHPGFWNQQYW